MPSAAVIVQKVTVRQLQLSEIMLSDITRIIDVRARPLPYGQPGFGPPAARTRRCHAGEQGKQGQQAEASVRRSL